jgi:hypothetical protein
MSETKVKLGVAFDLNGQAIALQPKEAIDEIKANGLELTLPNPVQLNSVGSGVDSILESLSSNYRLNTTDTNLTSIKTKVDDCGIDALSKFYDKVTTAELSIEKFHVKIPGSSTTEKVTKYTIGLSATWKKDTTITTTTQLSGLTLTGIYFEVSNE